MPCSHHRFGTGTVPVARVHTCSTASSRSGTSRPPRDVIAVERFRNGPGWLCGVNVKPDPFRDIRRLAAHSSYLQTFMASCHRSFDRRRQVQILRLIWVLPQYQICEKMIAVAVCLNFGRSGHYDISAY